jgi:hypothetical protein
MTATSMLLGVVAVTVPAPRAGDAVDPICRVLLLEERSEREDLELAVELADSELTAAQEIFELLDALRKNDAVERLLFLTGKHDRDAARLERERSALLLERQDALIEQVRLLCKDVSAGGEGSAYDRAYVRYLKADCGRLSKEAAIADVDLAYRREVLASVRDLRQNNVATRQDVILAERNVATARQRLDSGRVRTERCHEHLRQLGGANGR